MANKFIIVNDMVILGKVELHEDLLQEGEVCNFGGGTWVYDSYNYTIVFSGKSYGFGEFDKYQLQDIIDKKDKIFRYPARDISEKYYFRIE